MPDENPDQNKIEIRRAAEVYVERRRAPRAFSRLGELEKPPDLLTHWRVLRKHKWTVVSVFAVLFLIVLAATLYAKPTYRAKALLEIENENPDVASPDELFHLDDVTDTYLETQYKVLSSDELAQRVIDQLGLVRLDEFRPRTHWGSLGKIQEAIIRLVAPSKVPISGESAIREAVLANFEEKLDVKPFRRSSAVEISFDSQDPELAARVVNVLTTGYIQKNMESRWDAAQNASDWLSQKLSDLRNKLEKSQDDLQAYATANGLLFLETSQGNTESVENQSLRELQEELTHAEAARYETESLYRLIQGGNFGSLPGVFENKLMQDLTVRLTDLQSQKAELEATFTADYPKVKQTQSQIAEIQEALDRERQRAAQKISNDYLAAVRREGLVQQAFADKQKQVNLIAEKSVQYGILSREVDSNKTLYEGLLQRIKEAGISAGLKASNIRIVDKANVSNIPVYPKVFLNLGIAGVLGLGLGICVALLQDRLDQSIQNPQDVDHFLRVPVLAFIPSLKSLNGRHSGRSVRTEQPLQIGVDEPKAESFGARVIGRPHKESEVYTSSILSEAFRGLRTSVLLSSGSRSANSILVTSAQAGEGKTATAVNLAISLAQLGGRVLLIDADLRRPNVHKYFPQRGSHLSNYLADEGRWQDMVYQSSVSGLYVLLSGSPPLNPAELLSSDSMWALMREATTAYSFVVLDSPPVLDVADSRILASKVDATVLVVNTGATPRQAVQYAGAQVRSAGANLIGVVLNNIDTRFNDYSQFGYGRQLEEIPFEK
jgi:polysaccharide biosynthesis transport protein